MSRVTSGKVTHARHKKVIKAASVLGVPVVNTFIGRDHTLSIDENFKLFKDGFRNNIITTSNAALPIKEYISFATKL